MLQIAPSTYYERRAIARDPDRASVRAKADADLCVKIDAAWKDNRKLYGARKIWHVLLRDDQEVARCTVERLMRRLGLKGVLRGKKVITTNPDSSQPCPDDKVNRVFKADRPNQLWGRPLWRHWFKPNGRRLHLCADLVGNSVCGHSSGKRSPGPFSDPPHSLMSSRVGLSAGVSRHLWRPSLSSTPWSKRYGKEKRLITRS
jgi:hypothetical protein